MGMTNYETPRPSYRDLLDGATLEITNRIGINEDLAKDLAIRDMIRTIYAAASNGNAIAEDHDFARELFLTMCNTAQVELIKRLAEYDLKIALNLHLNNYNPFIEVIGDLFND
ncbi:MAG: hypothetical protein ACTHKQ_21430 [Mesorhizobium sp.]